MRVRLTDIAICRSVCKVLLYVVQFDWYYYMRVSLPEIAIYGTVWLILLLEGQFCWYGYILASLTDIAISRGIAKYRSVWWYSYIWVSLADVSIIMWISLDDYATYVTVWLLLLHTGQLQWFCYIRFILLILLCKRSFD